MRAQGYVRMSGPGGTAEADTITCHHCQQIVIVKPKAEEQTGFCRMCMKHICLSCARDGKCTPFEKKLDQLERAHRFHQTVGTVSR